jgi:hypothetical protein
MAELLYTRLRWLRRRTPTALVILSTTAFAAGTLSVALAGWPGQTSTTRTIAVTSFVITLTLVALTFARWSYARARLREERYSASGRSPIEETVALVGSPFRALTDIPFRRALLVGTAEMLSTIVEQLPFDRQGRRIDVLIAESGSETQSDQADRLMSKLRLLSRRFVTVQVAIASADVPFSAILVDDAMCYVALDLSGESSTRRNAGPWLALSVTDNSGVFEEVSIAIRRAWERANRTERFGL